MAANPIFPLYFNDYARSTNGWSDEEYGCYLKLLVDQWANGPLPNDMKRLKRIAFTVEENWPVIGAKFKVSEDGKWLVNNRLEEIRADRLALSKQNSENGAKGGRPKSEKKPKEKPNDNRNESETKPEGEAKLKPSYSSSDSYSSSNPDSNSNTQEPGGWLTEFINEILKSKWPGENRGTLEICFRNNPIAQAQTPIILKKLAQYAEYKAFTKDKWHGFRSWFESGDYLKEWPEMLASAKQNEVDKANAKTDKFTTQTANNPKNFL